MYITQGEEKAIESLVQRLFDRYEHWDRRVIPSITSKVKRSYSGEREIYDRSLLDLLGVNGNIAGQRILDIGSCGLNSSFDLVERGAEGVFVVEKTPFGAWGWQDLAYELIELKAKHRGVPAETVILEEIMLGKQQDPELEIKFDRAYFFFPPARMVGVFPEDSLEKAVKTRLYMHRIALFACRHLKDGGVFTVVTEVPRTYLNTFDDTYFKTKIRTVGGKKELYDEQHRISGKPPIPVRPASDLALSVITMTRTASENQKAGKKGGRKKKKQITTS